MLRHHVLLKFQDTATEEQLEALIVALKVTTLIFHLLPIKPYPYLDNEVKILPYEYSYAVPTV